MANRNKFAEKFTKGKYRFDDEQQGSRDKKRYKNKRRQTNKRDFLDKKDEGYEVN